MVLQILNMNNMHSKIQITWKNSFSYFTFTNISETENKINIQFSFHRFW